MLFLQEMAHQGSSLFCPNLKFYSTPLAIPTDSILMLNFSYGHSLRGSCPSTHPHIVSHDTSKASQRFLPPPQSSQSDLSYVHTTPVSTVLQLTHCFQNSLPLTVQHSLAHTDFLSTFDIHHVLFFPFSFLIILSLHLIHSYFIQNLSYFVNCHIFQPLV